MTDFNNAVSANLNIMPVNAGSNLSFVINNLEPDRIVYIAVVVIDEAGNKSTISNIASALTPKPSVIITELSGDPENLYRYEFIELYNSDSIAYNLTGWQLKQINATHTVTLSGTIPARSYFVIARYAQDFYEQYRVQASMGLV